MKNQKKAGEIKTCSKCFRELHLDQFYSKGNRIDSCCKACKKAQVRSTYVARKHPINLRKLQEFVTMACELEMKRLDQIINQLDEIIERRTR